VSRKIIVHAHIFKNAGSTFEWSLNRNLRKKFEIIRKKPSLWNDSNELNRIIDNNRQLTAISAHWVNLNHINDWQFDVIPYLLLRNPLERIKSVYNFEKTQYENETKSAKMAKKYSFAEYVEWSMGNPRHFVLQNYQTRFLSGDLVGEISEQTLNSALRQATLIPTIGCVDKYDESMVVLEEALIKEDYHLDLSYVRRNSSQDTQLTVQDKISMLRTELAGLYHDIENDNKYDQILYQNAQENLSTQINQIKDFDQKLDEFRDRCALVSKGEKMQSKPKFSKLKKIFSLK
jgi:hypothetical protein